jgi:hypothetical protein
MVLSSSALPYARLALESLRDNCEEGISLTLVTDSREDVLILQEELATLKVKIEHAKRTWMVCGQADLADLEQDKFGKFEHVRRFRHGHPCWRKITDPVLLSDDLDEMIVLDPDLYFPNRFGFEATVEAGVMLMWQRPSCLLPNEVVEAAIHEKIALAHHTDIGVAQWRMPVDLEWLNWLIGKLGSPELPRTMHVESIVWAALAMRFGGGHLDPRAWLCWHKTQLNRLLLKIGASGPSILNRESFAGIKCFHAGGQAKWWLSDAKKLGILDHGQDLTGFTKLRPYQELRPAQYRALQRNRRLARKLGYYSIMGGG